MRSWSPALPRRWLYGARSSTPQFGEAQRRDDAAVLRRHVAHGRRVLADPDAAHIVRAALLHGHRRDYRLLAWVIYYTELEKPHGRSHQTALQHGWPAVAARLL